MCGAVCSWAECHRSGAAKAGSKVIKSFARRTHTIASNGSASASKAFFLFGRCSWSCVPFRLELSIQPKLFWQSSSWFCALNTLLANSFVAWSSSPLLPAKNKKGNEKWIEITRKISKWVWVDLCVLCVCFINSEADKVVHIFRHATALPLSFVFNLISQWQKCFSLQFSSFRSIFFSLLDSLWCGW